MSRSHLKVVPFPAPPPPVRPKKQIIDHLKYALRCAQRGEVKALAISMVHNDDYAGGSFFADNAIDTTQLIGASEITRTRLIQRASEHVE